ncbi:ANTAR domain-containing protein [Streptomyces mangrovisoli]|uniref:ANTAR domain-containing protein n=1 Tax=Streptomyces mangrovisoli TaxID=1428628 RepID=A0A1J4P3Q6_9ACTN|nr:ANTAR domain-containing protein [Streptomyces mangrovisoli]OIJ68388.1 hypothetical protein WN71_008175 [Streptomyces mangrovisoli]
METEPEVFSQDEAVRLLREIEQLKRAMESRPVIDMARGMLMAGFACTPDEAWNLLVAVSQHANIKVRLVAQAVTSTAAGEPMPADLQRHLTEAVRAWLARRGPGPDGSPRR